MADAEDEEFLGELGKLRLFLNKNWSKEIIYLIIYKFIYLFIYINDALNKFINSYTVVKLSLYFRGAKGEGADLHLGGGGGQEDGIAMIFSHHIYCAQSNVKWGGGHGHPQVVKRSGT